MHARTQAGRQTARQTSGFARHDEATTKLPAPPLLHRENPPFSYNIQLPQSSALTSRQFQHTLNSIFTVKTPANRWILFSNEVKRRSKANSRDGPGTRPKKSLYLSKLSSKGNRTAHKQTENHINATKQEVCSVRLCGKEMGSLRFWVKFKIKPY